MALKYNSLAIIIPVHNEEEIIEKTVSKIVREISRLKLHIILLLVDDGSDDKTPSKLQSLLKIYPRFIKLKSHKYNKGYGAAVNTGIKYTIQHNIDYALFIDSDLTNDPKDIRKFVGEIPKSFDCVKASRYIKRGGTKGVPFSKYLISRLGNKVASVLLNIGISDCTNGFRMIKVNNFKNQNLYENDFSVIMEELYILKKRRANFKEIPVILINRKAGKSHFSYSFKSFYNYLKYPVKSLWI